MSIGRLGMRMDIRRNLTLRNQIEQNGLLIIAVAMALIYWVFDSMVTDQFWTRLLVVVLIFTYGMMTQFLINQRREAEEALQHAHDELEERVQIRTAELSRANEELQREIRERKQAEEQKKKLENQLLHAQKMEAIGTLAGGIAHDFNNLLTPILGFTDLVLESLAADDPRRADLTTVVRAASRARDLTAQLLAFGRKQVLDMLVLDLNEVVLESEPMVRRLLRENINLKLSLAADLGAVCADLSQIHNVLINLVVNAADAMPDGGTLTIETHNVDLDETYLATHPGSQPGPHVQLAVSDDGYGMDQRTIDLIFEPFFTTKSGGTGLGLATVHGIVKQHQGSVWVYSEPGRGSTFKIYLPRVVAVPLPLVPAAPRELRGSEQILVVEDDDAVRTLAAAVLTTYGYQVVAVASPAAAVDLMAARTDPFALLLSDVVMPGMNGAQLHRALSARWPQLPALYMSGYTSNVIAHHGILSEGTQFLQKPFSPADLARKVREVLDG